MIALSAYAVTLCKTIMKKEYALRRTYAVVFPNVYVKKREIMKLTIDE